MAKSVYVRREAGTNREEEAEDVPQEAETCGEREEEAQYQSEERNDADMATNAMREGMDYRYEKVDGQYFYYCLHRGCSLGGHKFCCLADLNNHRDKQHKVPPIEKRRCGRAPTGAARRQPPSFACQKMYANKRLQDVDKKLRDQSNLQKRRVTKRVLKEQGKNTYEELSEEGKRQIDEAMEKYDSVEN